MLHKLFSIAIILFFSFSGYAQNACSTYYPFKEGVKFEVTNYNQKDKITGLVKSEIKDATNNSVVLYNEVFDEKGKSLLGSELKLICNDEGIAIDFKSLIGGEVIKQYEAMNMEIDITGTNIAIPNNLSVGQTLPDAELLLTMSMASVKMEMTVTMTNRKVTGNDTITTPAGTFNCVVLTSDTNVKMGMATTIHSKQWLSKGYGVVKSEEYDNKGKLISKSILTKFED
jgi:hypothetical protein